MQNLVLRFVVTVVVGWSVMQTPSTIFATGKNETKEALRRDASGERIVGTPVSSVVGSVVNMMEVAARDAESIQAGPPLGIVADQNPSVEEEEFQSHVDVLSPLAVHTNFNSFVASPSPTVTFRGLQDTVQVGTSTSYIPPDTHGAVGLDKVMVTLNNNIRILDKATGAVISTASLNTFWLSTGATGLFDPRVLYDPYNDRWIVVATSNASSSSSSICVGVSTSSDPTGSYYLFKVTVGTSTLWADFPIVGFNKKWVVVSVNMFTIAGGSFSEGQVLSVDYPTLRGGTLSGTLFTGIGAASGGFCMNPAETFSSTEDTLFLVSHLSSGGATYKLQTMTGTSGSPTLTIGATKSNSLGAWAVPGGDILPQSPEPLPGTGTAAINCTDAYMRGNVVYRNGYIYTCQTVGLPSGGLTHTAVQWGKLSTAGDFVEGGRVEDPTATATNGGKWYAYASIAVNTLNDILLGFSQFSSAQYASAGYTFKTRGDAAGTMRDPYIYMAGLAYYEKFFTGSRNRWGDYSHTCVDPTDDFTLWTIQEYANTKVGTGDGSGRWDTWWAEVTPPDPLPIQLVYFNGVVVSTGGVRLGWGTLTELNNYGFEVEKSPNEPTSYQLIPNSFVPGHGTTLEPQHYSYMDTTATAGLWWYRLKQIDLDGTVHYMDGIAVDILTGVSEEPFPIAYSLGQNYPNPFNPTTLIQYSLPTSGHVSLSIYDVLGREVATLVKSRHESGYYESEWDATGFSSGVYFYRIQAGDYVDMKKLMLMK